MDHNKPFDAQEWYLCDAQNGDPQRWRTVSLVTAMMGILTRGPHFLDTALQRDQRVIRAVARELSARGLDALSLARYGMRSEVAEIVIGILMIKAVYQGRMGVLPGVDIARWHAALGVPPLQDAPGLPAERSILAYFEKQVLPAIPRIHQWIETAPLDDLVSLTPPHNGELPRATEGTADHGLNEHYTWAVDHFATTFYTGWRTKSLHLALRWLDGEAVPPCPEELMRDRPTSRSETEAEIAKRAVYGEQDAASSEASLAHEMTRHAVGLLRQGRYREAAAVFEFGTRHRPDDPTLRNNLGLCLIPEDPREALRHLQTAEDMGYKAPLTNAYNQMCCFASIGRSRAALNVAESAWNLPVARHTPGVQLWRRKDEGGWELFDCDDTRSCLAGLAASIAAEEGWSDEEATWRARAADRPAVS
ncbi:tetratricopeptide repeat protein [Spongiactinospora sp. 9N601]|uniref:tetratricopeptide repeat protein n=1 Tax=Spongiactinospora sp. 9N601 TaxID=3375149 RepID=UPI00378AF838